MESETCPPEPVEQLRRAVVRLVYEQRSTTSGCVRVIGSFCACSRGHGDRKGMRSSICHTEMEAAPKSQRRLLSGLANDAPVSRSTLAGQRHFNAGEALLELLNALILRLCVAVLLLHFCQQNAGKILVAYRVGGAIGIVGDQFREHLGDFFRDEPIL